MYIIGKDSLIVKCLIIGFSFSSKFESRLLDELEQDCILGFLVIFSFFVAVLDDNKALGESGGLDDDESDISLFCVSIGARDNASSRLYFGLQEKIWFHRDLRSNPI